MAVFHCRECTAMVTWTFGSLGIPKPTADDAPRCPYCNAVMELGTACICGPGLRGRHADRACPWYTGVVAP